jgi:hypothetical protein
MDVWLRGKRCRLDPARALGKGGEADVYEFGGEALKVWKTPDHPDLAGDAAAQEAARRRIAEYQTKLRVFPAPLPPRVVAPLELATDRSGATVLGYSMRRVAGADPLLSFGELSFRRAGVSAERTLAVLRDLRDSVSSLHRAGLVIGDFNDLNVLVRAEEAHLIDADSFQFGPYVCRLFTERFVDPLLCDPAAARPLPVKPHGTGSDWYAFTVLLMRSLLLVDPFGGVHRPASPASAVAHAARPLRRITVFHPRVVYPKTAPRPETLPDELLQHFFRVFAEDLRGEPPRGLLDGLRFAPCGACGLEHARAVCPACRSGARQRVSLVRVRGSVIATRLLATRGRIVAAACEDGRLLTLVHEDGAYRREDGSVARCGPLDPGLSFALRRGETLVGDGDRLSVVGARGTEVLAADAAAGRAAFAANGAHRYWTEGGRLLRDGPVGPERIGDVLSGQTRFWVGPSFGLGFYRAGDLSLTFVFDADARALNDRVDVPRMRGRLVRAACVFTSDLAWLLTRCVDGGRTLSRIAVVERRGRLRALAESDGGAWVDDACAGGGALAAGESLFVPTDAGLMRIDLAGSSLTKAREYPDTEPFVGASSALLPGAGGILVVDADEVRLLKIA